MLEPRLDTLPAAQRRLWPELAELPHHFVLYGGTALALRLGHRQSVDFDFFTSHALEPSQLLSSLRCLHRASILQHVSQTLTVRIHRDGAVKLSFFGGLPLGRVGLPERTADGVLAVASLLDLAGTKAAVITQRAEAKDYLDLLALCHAGVGLPQAMAAARAIYGESYNPVMTLKSLAYFGDGDLHTLTAAQKAELTKLAAEHDFTLPAMDRLSDDLAAARAD